MNCWQSLPKELQLRDADIASLSTEQAGCYFKLANQLGVREEFGELFYAAMQRVVNPDTACIQGCVDLLESYKRQMGRRYDRELCARDGKYNWLADLIALQYNKIEYNIRWLTDQYDCVRRTKPYLLEVRTKAALNRQ